MAKDAGDDLLQKYIQHVKACEGIDFIDELNSSFTGIIFTDEEVKKLKFLK
jgi:hypothetical protein